MEKCPKCKFKTVHDTTTINPDTDQVVEVASICSNCGHVVRRKEYEE